MRLDVLNVFKVENYSDYILGGNTGVLANTTVAYNPKGNLWHATRVAHDARCEVPKGAGRRRQAGYLL